MASGLNRTSGKVVSMIVSGFLLLVLGVVAGIVILKSLGVLLLVVGLAFVLLGSMGRAVGGRRHYW